ncbi:MAG TPA: WD40 repeat domain-containing serine/threonine protein kinase [Rhodanobacteraceae bacterium]|nr:WD40 repeat domain-containing serine/threonine protein kinase [Rhodanobacteraceae bacterium]
MTEPRLPSGGSKAGAGTPLQRARGLAELAFGTATDVDGVNRGRHLALLHVDTLELNLSDPAQRCFDDYELLELLGEGGMGVVYRARQISLDREVAIKLLSAGPWASRDFIARFEREAQNAARMQHPNIVAIHEVGSFEGLQFFSMQLVRGESLSAKLRRGETFMPRAAAALMRTVAEAVGYAHSLSVLHLDLKPANLLLDEAGTPYVADFGLARRLENALAAENDEVSGTPAYMAPEQAQVRAQKLTVATDIWGLGAILYELLTGQPPFRAGTAQATLKLVLEGTVRAPRRLRPDLPLDLQAIVLRCLRRHPRARYPSARALADDLQRYLEGRPVQARPLNAPQRVWRWGRREPKLAATALLAFALLVAGLLASIQQWRRAEAGAIAARDNLWATRAQTAQQALAAGDGFHGLRPLVANLAEMERAHRDADAAVERQRIGTILANAPRLLDIVRLPPGERATSIAIAPDGRHFAVATAYDIWVGPPHHVRQYDLDTLRETWSALSDHHTFLGAGTDSEAVQGGLRYTADGRFLLVSLIESPVVPAPRRSDMIAFDVRDGKILGPGNLPERQADIVYDDKLQRALVRFRSDLSLRWPDSGQFYEVENWQPIGPRHTRDTTLAADFWLPAPGGEAWLGTRDTAKFALYDIPSLRPRWRLSLPQTSLVRAWHFSHDGKRLALGSVDGAVRLVDVAAGRVVKLDSGPAERVMRVEFSADDRTLAALDENGQLWTWDAVSGRSRSAPMQFSRGAIGAVLLRFAGDTVFGSGNGEVDHVTLTPRALFNIAAVPGTARLRGDAAFTAFDVSASARRLVLGADAGLLEIWRLPPSPLLSARAAPLPADLLSFDGERIVAVDGNTVRVVDAASSKPRSPPLKHPEPVRFAELSPDGRVLVTIAGRTVRVIDTNTWQLRGTPIVLPQTPLRAAFVQAAPLLMVNTRDYVNGVWREQIHRIDLARGTLRKGLTFDALTTFEMDAQGRYAVIATWNSATHAQLGPRRIVLDGGSVTCVPALKAKAEDIPLNVALAADGRSAWFATSSQTGWNLQRWDLDACRKVAAAEPPAVPFYAVWQAHGDGLAVHRGGKEALLLIGADGKRQAQLGEAIPNAMYDFVLSADGTRAAFATRNAVHLIDTQQGRRLSAPLTAPIAGDDGIAKFAFSPDGTRLLARTINGRWLFWELPRTRLDTAALARLARALDPDPMQGLAGADLNALRAQSRSAAPIAATTPVASDVPIAFAPASGAAVDPRFVPLDLARAINIPLIGAVWPEPYAGSDRPTLAPGLQRFSGVDYRVDGGVQLIGGGTAVALGPELRRSAVVAVPDVVARRVHVLAFMQIPMDHGMPPRAFARVVLIGTDGRETSLEIRTVRDVVTTSDPNVAALSARIAFASSSSALVRLFGMAVGPSSNVYAVTLDVPPGTGPISGLRFDVADGPMEAPLFYAATLERAAAGPSGRSRPP